MGENTPIWRWPECQRAAFDARIQMEGCDPQAALRALGLPGECQQAFRAWIDGRPAGYIWYQRRLGHWYSSMVHNHSGGFTGMIRLIHIQRAAIFAHDRKSAEIG